jgi:ATP-dependent Clp protease ATP-binding subunit ClpC
MPTYRFPVLLWEDFQGRSTAGLVEYNQNSVGDNRAAAMSQLKEYLTWVYENSPWQQAPDFLDATLTSFKVAVRPEYRVGDRIFPCEESVSLSVACVHGRQESGLLVCALPMLDIRFYYYDPNALKGLVVTYVQESLKDLTPQKLSRYLPPKEVSLEEIVLQPAIKKPARRTKPTLRRLESVAEPLGEAGIRRQFSRAWERDLEVVDLVRRLTREKANVILVAEPGAGKTAVLVDAVRQIERQTNSVEVSEGEDHSDYPHKFWLTNGARLIAGMQYLGQWEERCEAVIEELSNIGGVLCVENLLDLVRTGGIEPAESIANFLLPYVQRRELRLVAEATPAELDACRRLLPAIVDSCQILNLAPLGREKAIAVLQRVVTLAKQNLGVSADDGIIELVYRLFARFFPYHAFPGKTVAFLNRLFEQSSIDHRRNINVRAIVDHFVRQTGLPELFLRDEIPLNETDVLEELNSRVIGQERACATAAGVITTFKAGLNDPGRPIAVLLFCGPTGVGKTELASSIARFFFGHGDHADRLIRVDMSEYAGIGAAQRLIGDPRGEPSVLIRRVRQQPFVVVLLDEIEKAAPEVFDVLLSLFDEGRLTDRYGRTTFFRSAVIIMTSNLGSERLDSIGFDKQAPSSYDAAASSFFRPEFFNRIDAIVQFNPLRREDILTITRTELSQVAQREGLTRSNIRLVCSEALINQVAAKGFDQRYGARPLQRTIETTVVAPLARYLVEHSGLRDKNLRADVNDKEEVVFG